MEKYEKYQEHLGFFCKEILSDILPFSVVVEYVKLLELLKFYNKNVEELNRYQSIQERFLCRLDKAREAKNQKVKKNRLNELSDEFLNKETRTLTIEEQRKIKEIDIFIDVYSERLRRIAERKQEELKHKEAENKYEEVVKKYNKVENETGTLSLEEQRKIKEIDIFIDVYSERLRRLDERKQEELKRKEAENKYEEVVKKYNKVENEILFICENIFRIIREIKKQIVICNLKEQQLDCIEVKEIHKEKIKAMIKEKYFRAFMGLSPKYIDCCIDAYLALLSHYIELKKCLFKEELPVAKKVISTYEQRPISLETINLELLDLDLEDELIKMICKFKNCSMFSEEQQENIIGNILQDINEWNFMAQACVQIADGVEVEENIEVLNGIKMEKNNLDTGVQTNNSLYRCAKAFKNLGKTKLTEEEHRSM